MSSKKNTTLAISDLIRGDILMSLGPDEFSKLLAWNGDSDYSHAMLVCDDAHLIEAAVSGVRKVALADRVRDHTEMRYIDVYRAVDRTGAPRPEDVLLPVATKANSFDGYPYAMNILKELAICVAIRNKLPKKRVARWAVRVALDHMMNDQSGHLTCTELLFRAYDEADVTPAHSLRPKIVVQAATHQPFPDIRWIKLWREVRALVKRSKTSSSARMLSDSSPATGEDMAGALSMDADDLPEHHPLIEDAELLTQMAAIRQRYSTPETSAMTVGRSAAKSVDWVDPAPNPQGVIPADFQTSPSYIKLGRLALISD